jgi:hypothetical protein
MDDLHRHELAHFVETLDDHQRVVLQRLLGEVLTSFPVEGQEVHPEWPALLRQSSTGLFLLLDLLRQYENNDLNSDIRPFALSVPEPGHARLLISKRINSWADIWDDKATSWVHDIKVGRLTLDLQRVEEVTSTVIAWFISLANHLPEKKVRLVSASPSLRRSIKVLRLQAILVCED